MPADIGKKKTAIERFFEWATNSQPAHKLFDDNEKISKGDKSKMEALEEIDKELGAPTPTPTPTPTKKKQPYLTKD